jgi:hypothetical protein
MIKNRLTHLVIAILASLLLVQCGTQSSDHAKKGKSEVMPLEPALKHGIKEVGAVNRFRVPDNWELTRHEEDARGYGYTWKPLGEKDVSLNVSWDGGIVMRPQPIQEILTQAPHALSREELASLTKLLGDRASAEAFQVETAKTEDVSGYRVLRVSGTYTEQDVYEDTIFVNSGGDCSGFQEVSFLSPAAAAAKYRKDADQAFSTLRIEESVPVPKDPATDTADDTSSDSPI